MRKDMIDGIDVFYAKMTINDVDRNTFLIHNIVDTANRLTTSLVFVKDFTSTKISEDNIEIVEYDGEIHGAVITLPAYWISVPKELAIPYIEDIIDNLYREEYNIIFASDKPTTPINPGGTAIPGGGSCPCDHGRTGDVVTPVYQVNTSRNI